MLARGVGVDASVDPRVCGNRSLGDGPFVRSEAEPQGRRRARPHGGGNSEAGPEPDKGTVLLSLVRCRSNHCIPEKPGLLLVVCRRPNSF